MSAYTCEMQSMNRRTLVAVRLCVALCAGIVFSCPQTQAQELAVDAPPNLASVAGAPFSAVATQQITREFTDGNRMARTVRVTRYYRDSGRTRIEREFSRQSAGAQATLQVGINEIDDPVSGQRYLLNPGTRTAEVLKGRTTEGVRAVGTRREYTLAAGAIGNEKPIGITIEQWFSPDLGMIVSKTGHATTGGASSYRLEHIVQGDRDPMLFAVPADYTRQQRAIASN
jgi:hypothetical protein